MKLVKKARLFFQEGNSDKVYEVDLCELPADGHGNSKYVVNFRYGRRGTALKEGSKTPDPVSLAEATKIYDSVVISKTNKGYQHGPDSDADTGTTDTASTGTPVTADSETQPPGETAVPGGKDSPFAKAQREITAKILERISKQVEHKQLTDGALKRLVWRAGELRLQETADALLNLLGRGDGLLDYCLVWSLGRLGTTGSFDRISSLNLETRYASVKRMSFAAMLELAGADKREQLLEPVRQDLSGELAGHIRNHEYEQLQHDLSRMVQAGKPETIRNLYDLYVLAGFNENIHQVLVEVIPAVEVTPNRFKALRYIYKTAEFRDDAIMLGVVNRLLESSPPYFRTPEYYSEDREVYLPGTWKRISVVHEAGKDNSRVAFSDRTREYFRRRTWRTLYRRAIAKDPSYADLATGVLLAMTDADGNQAYTHSSYRWRDDDSEWGTWDTVSVDYSDFCQYKAFNHILYGNSEKVRPDRTGRRWTIDKSINVPADRREEAWQELWDQRPESLVILLARSHAKVVNEFAVKALRANQAYWNRIEPRDLIAMLHQPYDCTTTLALEIARIRYNPDNPDINLLQALLESELAAARLQAQSWLQNAPQLFTGNLVLVVSLVSSVHDDMIAWGQELVPGLQLDPDQEQTVLARLFALFQGLTEESEKTRKLVDSASWHLEHSFSAAAGSIDLKIIEDLLEHRLDSLKVLGGRLLVLSNTPADQLPSDLFRALLTNTNPELRGLGVQLYGKLPLDVLMRQIKQIVGFCLSEFTEVRQATRPMIRRLADQDQEVAKDLARELMNHLFRSEAYKGLHDDIIMILTESLESVRESVDKNMTWRLLNAQSKAANRYGAWLLQTIPPYSFTVRQWSKLGKNQVYEVREWAWKSFNDHVDTVKQNPVDALRILETRWDDTRQQAMNFFREHFDDSIWTPELMISVCDSIRDDVQEFGRELITRFFQEGHGAEYLCKLSQHPSVNVQLFTTNYLTSYASGNLERIKELSPYFVTVLSHVNKARVAKQRVVSFLHQQAMESEDVARVVADILSRQSVTMVLRDHTRYLLAMRDLKAKYPFIELPIRTRTVSTRSGKTAADEKAANHAV